MGRVYKRTVSRPLPAGAKVIVRKGCRLAEWTDARGKRKTAPLTDAGDRILQVVGTYTAEYRDGAGALIRTSTGCRTEAGARKRLADLETRTERIKARHVTVAEDRMIDRQSAPLVEHLDAYLTHLKAKGDTADHIVTTRRQVVAIATECGFVRLSDLDTEAVERWLSQRTDAGMANRTRNTYLQAIKGFCGWCVLTERLAANPLARVGKLDEQVDRRRHRRALTEPELLRLLFVARRRPLAELGRETVRKPAHEAKGRRTWSLAPLTFDTLDAAVDRARQRVKPAVTAQREALGRERAMIYKTLVMTGLRQDELRTLTVAQLHLDADPAHLDLDPADEKNREGSIVPIRSDLVADLRQWLRDKATDAENAARDAATVRFDRNTAGATDGARGGSGGFAGLPGDSPVFTVPPQLVKILDRDLRTAGIPKRDDRGRTIDVHAMRHTFGTLLSKGGVNPRTAQSAMRHSRIDLTMNVYTDPKLLDTAGAVEKLPELPLDLDLQPETARATGTDDLTPDPDRNVRLFVRYGTGNSATRLATICKNAADGGLDEKTADRAVNPCRIKSNDPLATHCKGSLKRGRRDSNPQPLDRQASDDGSQADTAQRLTAPAADGAPKSARTEPAPPTTETENAADLLTRLVGLLSPADRDRLAAMLTKPEGAEPNEG
jgi:integrase